MARRLRWWLRSLWWQRLVAWGIATGVAVLVGGWAWCWAGLVGFEMLRLVVKLAIRRRAVAGGGPRRGPGGSGGAGVREPRRPLPVSGAGAAQMPIPGS